MSIEEAYTDDFLGIGERRTQSFNEGYLRRKLQRTHSGDSVLSFYSHVSQIYSSAEESPREGEEYKYPKSEVSDCLILNVLVFKLFFGGLPSERIRNHPDLLTFFERT